MSFEIQRTTKTLPGRAAAVRANIDVDTGGQLVGRAVAELGASIFNLGAMQHAKQAKEQSDTAESEARLSMVQLMQDIRNEDDVEKWRGLYGKHESRVLTFMPKNKAGAARYKSALKRLKPVWENMFVSERDRKLEDNMLTASLDKVDGIQKAATFENMAEAIKKIRAELRLRDKLSYSISSSDTQILLADVGRDVQTSAAENLALNRPKELLARIKGNKIEGFKEIREATEAVRLENMAQRTISRLLASVKETREVEINSEQGRLMNLLREGKLTEQDIRTSLLDEFGVGSKDTFYKSMDARAKAVLEEKKTPYTESDPVVEARMLDRIRDPDEKIAPKDISELVGRGLSIDDASRMIDNLQVLSDPWFKRVDLYLKSQLGWDGAYEKFLHPQGGIAYKLAGDKLFDAIETEKLRGKDIYERGSEIAIPFVVDYWEKVLMLDADKIKSMRRMLEGEAKTAKPEETKEPTVPLKKKPTKIDPLDPLGIFK